MAALPEFVKVIDSREFREALSAVTDAPIRYEDFLELPMPEGCSHDDVWHALIIIEKVLGHVTSTKPWFKNVAKDESWYYIPRSVAQDIENLAAIASERSHINRIMRRQGFSDSAFLPAVWEEVSSLARRDGLPVPERTIRGIWLGEQEPADANEKVVANLAQAFYDMEKLMRGNVFSRVVIMEAHDMLTRGVGELELMPQLYFSASLGIPNRLSDPDYVSESLDGIVQETRAADQLQEKVIQAVENSLVLWDLSYVPSLRCLTDFLVRRAYFLAKDLPAYSYFPFSSKLEQMGRPYLNEHESEYLAFAQEGLNTTWIYAGGIRAYLECARDMVALCERTEAQEKTAKERIENMGSLNARQKAFALAALDEPEKSFKIRDYMDMHEVAYATAHNDLKAMVDLGVFSMRKEGKAFVFQLA